MLNEYTNHSGGCKGADMEWDRIGRKHGFFFHKHYRPADLKALDSETRQLLETEVLAAAHALGRPKIEFPGKDLVRRNWFQADRAEAIFAISKIVNYLEVDKGFPNLTGRQIVSGGTAWACEMAIQKGKPVHVFNTKDNLWYFWNGVAFQWENTPLLTKNYAGIGSRNIGPKALQAIEEVYLLTIKNQ